MEVTGLPEIAARVATAIDLCTGEFEASKFKVDLGSLLPVFVFEDGGGDDDSVGGFDSRLTSGLGCNCPGEDNVLQGNEVRGSGGNDSDEGAAKDGLGVVIDPVIFFRVNNPGLFKGLVVIFP